MQGISFSKELWWLFGDLLRTLSFRFLIINRKAFIKAGTFHAYPTHSVDAYKPRAKKGTTVNSSGKIFQQPNWPKSRPTKSVMNQQIVRTMNANNYKTFSSVSTYWTHFYGLSRDYLSSHSFNIALFVHHLGSTGPYLLNLRIPSPELRLLLLIYIFLYIIYFYFR